MKRFFWAGILIELMVVVAGCGGGEKGDVEDEVGAAEPRVELEQPAFYLSTVLWKSTTIPVCWENPDGDPTGGAGRDRVRTAVAESWEANSRLRFTGWTACAEDSKGIRIFIAEDTPHTNKLGKDLDGRKQGMVLNFTFKSYNETCPDSEEKRLRCIQRDAVHEFGHAIGFVHEHNRLKTPDDCRKAPAGSLGDSTLGDWDRESVMNYCSGRRSTAEVTLSLLDIAAVRTLYGDKRGFSASSTQSVTVRDITLLAEQTLTAGTCGVADASGNGDTVLSLYDSNNVRVAINDNGGTGCGKLSKLTYKAPSQQSYQLRVSCASSSCNGMVAYDITGGAVAGRSGKLDYSASNTADATANTVKDVLRLQEGRTFTAGTCGVTGSSGTGDTYLRLYDSSGRLVASNNDGDGSCGKLSKLTYKVEAPETGMFGSYELRAGCASNSACSGTVTYTYQ